MLREEETHSRKAVMEAEKMAGVSLITMERKLNATVSRLEIVDMEGANRTVATTPLSLRCRTVRTCEKPLATHD